MDEELKKQLVKTIICVIAGLLAIFFIFRMAKPILDRIDEQGFKEKTWTIKEQEPNVYH